MDRDHVEIVVGHVNHEEIAASGAVAVVLASAPVDEIIEAVHVVPPEVHPIVRPIYSGRMRVPRKQTDDIVRLQDGEQLYPARELPPRAGITVGVQALRDGGRIGPTDGHGVAPQVLDHEYRLPAVSNAGFEVGEQPWNVARRF